MTQSERDYHQLGAYGAAKLANLAWSVHLARRLEGTGVTVLAADPGVADTGTHRDYDWPAPAKAVMVTARPLLSRLLDPRRAASSSVRAATAPEFEGRTGLLLDRKGRPSSLPSLLNRPGIGDDVERASRLLARLGEPSTTPPSDGRAIHTKNQGDPP